MIEPKSDGEIHTKPREFEQTSASQLCDKMNQPRIILKTNIRQRCIVLVVFQPERYNIINFSSCCFSSRKCATVFKTSPCFTGWDIRVNQLFFKKWRRKVPGGAAGLQNQSGDRKVPGGFDSLPSPPEKRRSIIALRLSPQSRGIGSPKLHSPLRPETRYFHDTAFKIASRFS